MREQEHAVRIETASLRESMSESFECHEQNKVDIAFVFLCVVRNTVGRYHYIFPCEAAPLTGHDLGSTKLQC